MIERFEGVVERGSPEEFLLRQIDPARLPRHVAIIMDGNGRWANRRDKPRVSGHRAGASAVREAVETSARLGIECLTLYAFSTENWKRPRFEVETLMRLLREFIRRELGTLLENNIRFRTIGRTADLAPAIQRDLDNAMAATAALDGMTLTVALNYSGRAELVDACRRVAAELARAGRDPDSITEDDVARHLYAPEVPDPDLLIRTSGELRVSNFMLWQIAYTEIHVTETLWPDFSRAHLFEAVLDFQTRERRFGGVGAQSGAAVEDRVAAKLRTRQGGR